MNSQILFDTSIWIDFFNGKKSEKTDILARLISDEIPIFVCPPIIQEILQGIKSDKQYEIVKESLLECLILMNDSVEAAVGAANIYRKLRQKGITIRKSNDCLIAWYALENGLEIIHNDRDFDLILNNWDAIKA